MLYDDLNYSVVTVYFCCISLCHIHSFFMLYITSIEHYAQLGQYKLLETCILQLNPKCLDIHQVWYCTVTYLHTSICRLPSICALLLCSVNLPAIPLIRTLWLMVPILHSWFNTILTCTCMLVAIVHWFHPLHTCDVTRLWRCAGLSSSTMPWSTYTTMACTTTPPLSWSSSCSSGGT